jgi:hypothetical protein
MKAISHLVNSADSEAVGREMVLRALEWRDQFAFGTEILDSLARTTGLYPYADPEALDLRDRIAYEFHRPDNMGEAFVFHREQAEIYRRLVAGENIILSAPTSFGKSRLIDAMIVSARYDNIAVIVPTLALIDETRRRLSGLGSEYKIVSHLSQKPARKNIFVFTAERAVAFQNLPKIDFFVIDEFYKIGAMDEDEARTVALNEAFYRLLKDKGQFYLLGPNIQQIPEGIQSRFTCFFLATKFATVVVETMRAPGKGKDISRLLSVVKTLSEPTLIFCSSPPRVNEVARAMIDAGIGDDTLALKDAAEWVGSNYHPDWVFGNGLLHGIGIHHGRLPRSLAQFVVGAFNDDKVKFLICTSTLIEGVNTKAKNVLVWDTSIAKRPLDFFTYSNIKGRSGRMFQHFVGRVILFDDPPQEELPFVDFPFVTQDVATPTALLIQMDDKDLSEKSKDRIKQYSNDSSLSLETLKKNRSCNPDNQIKLARYIYANAEKLWQRLAWSKFPSYKELSVVCELMWTFLVESNKRNGVFSAKQLTLKTWQLYRTASTSARVLAELKTGQWAAKTPDEAVERVLQFERNWAGFELPRLLLATSRIQQEVLTAAQLPCGDYSVFASSVESLFRTPVIAALDEYGIPLMVAEKLGAFLRTREDLDVALTNLKRLVVGNMRLGRFEKELVTDAQDAL